MGYNTVFGLLGRSINGWTVVYRPGGQVVACKVSRVAETGPTWKPRNPKQTDEMWVALGFQEVDAPDGWVPFLQKHTPKAMAN